MFASDHGGGTELPSRKLAKTMAQVSVKQLEMAMSGSRMQVREALIDRLVRIFAKHSDIGILPIEEVCL